jgi:integrase/recombinase XerD
VESYLTHLTVDKGLSERSIEAYSQDITGFLIFLNSHDARLESVTDDTLFLYLVHLRSRGLASRSLARHLSALRGFFAFAADESWLPASPAALIENPKLPRRTRTRRWATATGPCWNCSTPPGCVSRNSSG